MTFFSRCILAFLIAAISSELVQARSRRAHSEGDRLRDFPKGNKELLVRVAIFYEEKYLGVYVATKGAALCLADNSVPCDLFNRSKENELLERAERNIIQLQYAGVLNKTTPLKPEDLKKNYRKLVDFCALNHDAEQPYKDGQFGLLKSEDSEYSSSSGDQLPENATVPIRDDEGYPHVPGCKLEKVDLNHKRGRGCRRYENSDGQLSVECLYHDCGKEALGKSKKHKVSKEIPTSPKLPSRPTERQPKPPPSRPTEGLPVVPLEQSEAARGSDAAKEAERVARKVARKAEKQAERKREREARKKHKATSQ